MRKKLLSVMMGFFISLFSGSLFAEDAMKMVYFNNYPPFSWEDENRVMRGILIDTLTEAIETRMKIKLSHHGYPWARAQKMVEEGNADAFATVPTPARREYTEVSSEPVIIAEITIFANKTNPQIEEIKKIKKIEDLRGFKIVDYIGSGWSEKNLAGFERDLSPEMNTVLIKLSKGRGDIFVQTSQVTNFTIKKLGLQNELIEVPVVLDSVPFSLCIGKKSPYVKILKDFDETIRKMRQEKKIDEIYNNYK